MYTGYMWCSRHTYGLSHYIQTSINFRGVFNFYSIDYYMLP
jgi:hypothetical protein